MTVVYEFLTDITGPRGLKGERGEPGIAGGNALANDAATATYVESSASSTRAALDSRYATRQDATPLLYFHGRLGNRQSAPANIVFLGDSISTEYGANAAGRGFGPQCVQRLRSMYPIDSQTGYGIDPATAVGGYGMVAGYPSGNILQWFLTQGNLVFTGNYEPIERGWGLSAVRLSGPLSNNTSMKLKFRGTACDIYFEAANVNTSVLIKVDAGADVQHIQTPGGPSVYRVSGLTLGEHEVLIKGQYGTDNIVTGIMTYSNDPDWGIRFVNAGKSGAKAVDFAPTLGGNSSWLNHWNTLPPHLIVISFGTNDVTGTVASYQAALQDIADAIRAKSTVVPIVFAMMFRRGDRTQAVWDTYKEAMKSVQANTARSLFVDLGERFPDGTTADNLGLMSDALHPNSAGHGVLGHYLAEVIAPRM